jgi:cytoskeleton protein RodZ
MARGNFGERLKRERELREVSLKEVTVATRISSRYLEALENEDWGRLPGGAFNRGFVRAIARYLGLDEEDLLAEYDLAVAERSAGVPPLSREHAAPFSRWLMVGAALAIALVVAGLVAAGIWGWRRYTARRHTSQGIQMSSYRPGPVAQCAPGPLTRRRVGPSQTVVARRRCCWN